MPLPRKLLKLLKKPRLFFSDAIKKRTQIVNKKSKPTTGINEEKTLVVNSANLLSPIYFALHTGESADAACAHLDLWVPFFENDNLVIIVRDILVYERVRKRYPYNNTVFAKKVKDIEVLFQRLPLLKACFYPSNTGNNISLLHQNNLRHIFIGHGDSDKTASAHKFFRVYDQIWTAGPAHKDRFINAGFCLNGLDFVEVGRPNLLNTIKSCSSSWQDRFGENINLLYLPTWEGIIEEQAYSSLPIAKETIQIINDIDLIKDINIKLHPLTGKRDSSFKNLKIEIEDIDSERIFTFEKDTPVSSLIPKTNIYICDISAVVSECLSGNSPIFVYIPKNNQTKIAKSHMEYDFYAYTFSNKTELKTKLEEVLSGNDYLHKNREIAMEYILGKTSTLHRKFKSEIEKISHINN